MSVYRVDSWSAVERRFCVNVVALESTADYYLPVFLFRNCLAANPARGIARQRWSGASDGVAARGSVNGWGPQAIGEPTEACFRRDDKRLWEG